MMTTQSSGCAEFVSDRKINSICPIVSVIVPTYNRSNYLGDAVRSLLAQDYPLDCFEIIIVDNGSTDDTQEQVHEIAKGSCRGVNMKYIREVREGLVFTRHSGAAHAEGKILIFTDDDAVFDDNWVSAIVDVYNRHPEVGAVGTKIAILWDRDPEPWVRNYEGVLGKLHYGDDVIVQTGLEIFGGSFSIRKDFLLQVGGFNPGQKGEYIIGDSEIGLCRKLAMRGIPAGWTPRATMWHVQTAAKNGTLNDIKRRFINCGISDAYFATFYGWTFRRSVGDIRDKTKRIMDRFLTIIRHGDWEGLGRSFTLEKAQYWGYIKYLWLYRFSIGIRREVLTRDWEFSPNYEAPPLEFSFKKGKMIAGKS